jgi:hypothetical protein
MMRTTLLTLSFAGLIGGTALVAPAMAQDVIVEHYDDDTGVVVTSPSEAPVIVEEEDGPVIVEEYAAEPPRRYEPPVYGWTSEAPANCGTFRYWDGESCADARYDSPNE